MVLRFDDRNMKQNRSAAQALFLHSSADLASA
jgi:hypothetical protein